MASALRSSASWTARSARRGRRCSRSRTCWGQCTASPGIPSSTTGRRARRAARRADVPLAGVGLPGHYVVAHFGASEPLILDPFGGGAELTASDERDRMRAEQRQVPVFEFTVFIDGVDLSSESTSASTWADSFPTRPTATRRTRTQISLIDCFATGDRVSLPTRRSVARTTCSTSRSVSTLMPRTRPCNGPSRSGHG